MYTYVYICLNGGMYVPVYRNAWQVQLSFIVWLRSVDVDPTCVHAKRVLQWHMETTMFKYWEEKLALQ